LGSGDVGVALQFDGVLASAGRFVFRGDGELVDADGSEKIARFLVTAGAHQRDLGVCPRVEFKRADEGIVNAKAAMFAGALQADPSPVGHARPCRVLVAAVNAPLIVDSPLDAVQLVLPCRHVFDGQTLDGAEN
jgi:hypothetical protein